MPSSEGRVKDATDHEYDFLRPVALMCIGLLHSQSLVYWFSSTLLGFFFMVVMSNLLSCRAAKEKINFSLDQRLPMQESFSIEV